MGFLMELAINGCILYTAYKLTNYLVDLLDLNETDEVPAPVDTLSVTPAKCRQMETLSGKQSPAMCHPTSKWRLWSKQFYSRYVSPNIYFNAY